MKADDYHALWPEYKPNRPRRFYIGDIKPEMVGTARMEAEQRKTMRASQGAPQ